MSVENIPVYVMLRNIDKCVFFHVKKKYINIQISIELSESYVSFIRTPGLCMCRVMIFKSFYKFVLTGFTILYINIIIILQSFICREKKFISLFIELMIEAL